MSGSHMAMELTCCGSVSLPRIKFFCPDVCNCTSLLNSCRIWSCNNFSSFLSWHSFWWKKGFLTVSMMMPILMMMRQLRNHVSLRIMNNFPGRIQRTTFPSHQDGLLPKCFISIIMALLLLLFFFLCLHFPPWYHPHQRQCFLTDITIQLGNQLLVLSRKSRIFFFSFFHWLQLLGLLRATEKTDEGKYR